MFTQKFINEMGGTELNFNSWEGKYFLRRIALMPMDSNLQGSRFHTATELGFLRYSDYNDFLKYPKNNLQ